jgi:hypothetical protein
VASALACPFSSSGFIATSVSELWRSAAQRCLLRQVPKLIDGYDITVAEPDWDVIFY